MLTLLDGMSFDWPSWLKSIFFACTSVALNVNLTMAHCFGFFPSLTHEWIAYMLVPWLHLLLNLGMYFIVRLLQRLSQAHSRGGFTTLVKRMPCSHASAVCLAIVPV